MAKSNLLKEAIADAKAVRETAIANAKLALEEAFTPKLQSMLSRKIEEETTEEDEDTVDEITGSSTIGNGDNKVDIADGDDEEKPETTKQSAAYGSEDSNNSVVDKLTENEDEDEEAVTEGEDGEEEETTEMHDMGEDEELDLDLEEIIRELEGEDEEETTEMAYEAEDEEHSEMKETEDELEETEDEEEMTEGEEEELDLDEIIKSLKEEDDDEDEVNEAEDDESEKVSELTEKLSEAYKAIKTMKSTLTEVNLLNAKLLFSNKLFKSHNLTEGQKMSIIETFDRAISTREVKLVYTTLAESLSSGASKKSTIKESFASKATKSTKPSQKTVIVEADQFTNRMKKLAGLLQYL